MTGHTRFCSFRQRLLVRLTLLALVAMLLASIAQVFLITREQRQQQELLLHELTSIQVPLLQVALWDIEIGALQGQLERIAGLSTVAGVRLHSETGLDMQAGDVRPHDGNPESTLVIPSPTEHAQRLGELQIFFQHHRLVQRIIDSILHRVFELSLYTLLVFTILFRALHREVGRPLQLIADYVSRLKPQKHAPPLVLSRAARNWHDEIDLVSRGFETLHAGMRHYAEQHELAIEQLASERDSLDRRVEERTSELAYLNGYLKLISGSSLKLMHLHHAQYPQAMHQTLKMLGYYLHLDASALLDNHRLRVHWTLAEDPQWLERLEQRPAPTLQSGWSIEQLDDRSLLIHFISPQHSFGYAVRGRTTRDVAAERKELLQGAGQWLFSLLQHWDHVIGLEQARQELLEMSRTDPLTGLANRRHFEQHQTDELHRAQRMGYPISLLMLDVDFFKAFNDLYGHAEGDACLMKLAGLVNLRFKRTGEMAARLGGEEFAVLLPGMGPEAARQAADSLGMAIYDLHVPHAGSVWGRVTVSIGCASWTGQPVGNTEEIIDGLMRTADAALYEAKDAGRNQVVAARGTELSAVQ
ncbi:GGDEF domain-containing protein [Pseudomonas sp. MYb185]|uniref:GGDEF domain-containing protein n=1 Tax=Pseudomonas sp. MYb185 TaxID=1848729 RepID=UPI000CFDF040|nr:GGDEF domain-containing protein [Pseudomonas sp. MYb185]PRB74785.1 hypothetical protein CQ007_18260 [Pseudomonas sp. MYb185]